MKVSLSHVSKFYGGRAILRDICEELCGLCLVTGINGAGKSTLLRIVAGLARPDTGSVAASGTIGYLGHATFLYPDLTARENLLFWSRANALGAVDVDAALERVGLARAAEARARVFSRGMMQRLNLARVLLCEPEVFLLDEPATGLDEPARELLRGEVTRAARAGACVLFASHDSRDAAIADRVLAIRDGRLVEA